MIKRFPLQFVLTLTLFLLISSSYFWEGEFGMFSIVIFALLFTLFFLLFIELIRQLHVSIKNKFSEKSRNYISGFMAFCMTAIAIKPTGLVNFENFYGKNLYVAYTEGVASCTATLKIKEGGTFIYENICFGAERTFGHYKLKKDTIFFSDYDKSKFDFKFGKINLNDNEIELYSDKSKISYPLRIIHK